MATVFRAHGFRFMIYPDDHPPPHIHVIGQGGEARVRIDKIGLLSFENLTRGDLRHIFAAVTERQGDLLKGWTVIHGEPRQS